MPVRGGGLEVVILNTSFNTCIQDLHISSTEKEGFFFFLHLLLDIHLLVQLYGIIQIYIQLIEVHQNEQS